MATCVRCKSEIDPSLKYCPICGAKQNMHIDANQVVGKNLIDNNKFDPSKDVLKTPKVEIIIDDSEAATPFEDYKGEASNINRIEELPSPNIKEADNSDYEPIDTVNIEIDDDKKEDIIEEETTEEAIVIKETDELTYEEEKSKKVNTFNAIFNFIINGLALFLVGFPYFYETSNMLFIRIITSCKRDLINITSWDEIKYYGAFGVISLALALICFIIYMIEIFVAKKPKFKDVRKYRYHGLSMALIFSTLYFNTLLGNFKLSINYLFRIYSYLIILAIIMSLIVNMSCRLSDPLGLNFKWGYVRYNINNYESLPKLPRMDKFMKTRKITYVLLVCILSFTIYLKWLMKIFNYDPNTYTYLISRYVSYKASFGGTLNIFKPFKNILDMFYAHGYSYHIIIYSVFMIIAILALIGYEYWGKGKTSKVSSAGSLLYVIAIIVFTYSLFRSFMTLFSILDGAGVNENIDAMIIGCIISEMFAYLTIIIVMIVERYANNSIVRKKLSIYKQE